MLIVNYKYSLPNLNQENIEHDQEDLCLSCKICLQLESSSNTSKFKQPPNV